MAGPWNTGGTRSFHRTITTQLKSAMNTTTATAIAIPFATRLITQPARLLTTLSSFRQPVLVYGLQPLAQLQHRIALARQQRVDALARALGELAEGQPVELLRDEHLALLARQLFQRRLDLIEEHGAHRRRLRRAVRGRQQLVQRPLLLRCAGGVQQQLRTLPAEAVDDAIARHAQQPRANLLDRLRQALRRDQLVERVLQDV